MHMKDINWNQIRNIVCRKAISKVDEQVWNEIKMGIRVNIWEKVRQDVRDKVKQETKHNISFVVIDAISTQNEVYT